MKRVFLTAICAVALAAPAFAQTGEVNVYSYREQKLLQPLLCPVSWSWLLRDWLDWCCPRDHHQSR